MEDATPLAETIPSTPPPNESEITEPPLVQSKKRPPGSLMRIDPDKIRKILFGDSPRTAQQKRREFMERPETKTRQDELEGYRKAYMDELKSNPNAKMQKISMEEYNQSERRKRIKDFKEDYKNGRRVSTASSSDSEEDDDDEEDMIESVDDDSNYEVSELQNEVDYLNKQVKKIQKENFKLRAKLRAVREAVCIEQ